MPKRLNFIDVARAYAIALALFSHAMITFGGWAVYDDLWARTFTRTATPLFVFMFGLMLELVYVRRARRDGVGSVTPRLLKRSAQCYVGFALTAIAGVVGGYLTVIEAGRALVFVGDAHYGNILRLYTVALALAPALIWLRLRSGVRVLFGLLAAVWGLDALILDPFEGASFGPLTSWVGVIMGTGLFRVGPSVIHGFTFVLVGMLVGTGLSKWRERGLTRFYVYAGIALAAALGVVAVLAAGGLGSRGVLEGFVEYAQFRGHNHIGYYAVGTALCLVTLLGLAAVVPRGALPAWSAVPLQFGQFSLLSYSLGNVLLNLIPQGLGSAYARGAPVTAAAFVLGVLAVVNGKRIASVIQARLAKVEVASS